MTFPAIPHEREISGVAPFRRNDAPTPVALPTVDDRDTIVGESDALRYVMFRVDQVARLMRLRCCQVKPAPEGTAGAPSTGAALGAPERWSSSTAPRFPQPGGERALRPRAWSLHRRPCDSDWPVRAGPSRTIPARRSRGAARAPAEAATGAPGGPGRTARQSALSMWMCE